MTAMTAGTLAEYLADEFEDIVWDSNLFVDRVPAKPNVCVSVITFGGVRDRGTNEEIATFQIRVRGAADDPVYANALLRQIADALFALRAPLTMAVGTDDEARITGIEPGVPYNLGWDANDRSQWALRVVFRYVC
jgi:hypothetical protein